MTHLNGIDISHWQTGIDLAAVPADFVIVKATQGTGYVSPDCSRQVETALKLGRIVGIYHYVGGGDAKREAAFFYENCRNWRSRVFWCIDWEAEQNSAYGNTAYLDTVVGEVARLTGKPPIIYAGAVGFPWDVARRHNSGTWCAQYANMNRVDGYQTTPWNEGAYSCTIRQYTGSGRLPGYNGNLDLNKFYGSAAQLRAYIPGSTGGAQPSKPAAPARKSNDQIAGEVIAGKWGNGADRVNRLRKAGYDANAIQQIVNKRLGTASKPATPARKSNDQIASEVIQGRWGNDPQRSASLRNAGYDPTAIQNIVNKRLGATTTPARKSNDQIATEVIRGNWGNEPQRSQRLRAAGYDPTAIQQIVNRRLA